MKTGKRRHKVTLQRATNATSASGAVTRTYATLQTAWASIEPITGQEQIMAQQNTAKVSHRISVPRTTTNKTLNADDRISYGSRLFDVAAVLNVEEKNRELEVLAIERPAQ